MTEQNYIHSISANGRWFQFSILEQLGNIGGEVQRYINAKARKHDEHAIKAFERALELIDLTKLDPKNTKKLRYKEIALFRDLLCDTVLYDGKEFNTSIEYLNEYCNQFAMAARYHRDL